MFAQIESYGPAIAEFVRNNQGWAAPIVFALAFAESLAFFSLFVPAWAALVAIGVLIGASGIPFWPVMIAGGVGAALGDWLSYWFGYTFKEKIAHMWPLSRYPDMLPRAHAFMDKWGAIGIVFGRFSGPLRATVPLIAGIVEMEFWRFQLANWSSAFLWSYVLLQSGDAGQQMLKKLI